jgi:CheY-like chemotaxis protein
MAVMAGRQRSDALAVSRGPTVRVGAPEGPLEQRCVLVVEDNPGVVALLRELLTRAGYAVAAFDSALGSLAAAQRLRPCAILLDLGLPYRSGASLLASLKADPQTTAIPVIVVSALPDLLPPERAALTAAILAKPFRPAALLAAVRTACGDAV